MILPLFTPSSLHESWNMSGNSYSAIHVMNGNVEYDETATDINNMSDEDQFYHPSTIKTSSVPHDPKLTMPQPQQQSHYRMK